MRFIKRNFHIKEYAQTYAPWILIFISIIFLILFFKYIYLSRSTYSEIEKRDNTEVLRKEFTKKDGLYDLQNTLSDGNSLLHQKSILIKCKQVALQLNIKIDCSDYEKITRKQHQLINTTMLAAERAILVLRETKKLERTHLKEVTAGDRRAILSLLDFYTNTISCVDDARCDEDGVVRHFGKSMYGYVNRFCEHLNDVSFTYNQQLGDKNLVSFLIKNKSKLPADMFVNLDNTERKLGFRCGRYVKMHLSSHE